MANAENKSIKTMVVLVIVAAIIVAVALYFYTRSTGTEEPVSESIPTAVEETPAVAEPEQPKPVYQAPEPQPEEEPLPPLAESDKSVLASVEELSETGVNLIVPEEVIRKFVRAISAAEEGKVVHEYRPLVSPAPPFKVESIMTAADQQQFKMSEENYQRYDKYVKAFTAMEPEALVATYKHYYPLLEDAFREMGAKKGNFHSVVLNAIDSLLATPDLEGDILLVRPKVFYQFADPELEKLPASQKLILRMGPENTRKIKAKLQELRPLLAQ